MHYPESPKVTLDCRKTSKKNATVETTAGMKAVRCGYRSNHVIMYNFCDSVISLKNETNLGIV